MDGQRFYRNPSSEAMSEGERYMPRDSVLLIVHQTMASAVITTNLEAVSSTVRQRCKSERDGLITPASEPVQVARTVVEVVVSGGLTEDFHFADPDPLKNSFEHALRMVNEWLSALAIVLQRPYTPVRRELCPYFLPVATGSLEPWELLVGHLPRLEVRAILLTGSYCEIDLEHEPQPSEIDDWLDAAPSGVSNQGPFVRSHIVMQKAQMYEHWD